MDKQTRQAMKWLDYRYRVGVAEGRYRAHEPIYGVGCSYAEGNQALRLARTYSIFRRLAQMQFDTLLDVGGAEGYHAGLARRLFSAQAVTSDLSLEASLRARELFGLPAVASDARWLPYQDDSFDVVLCCEVLEHVSDPVAVMCEVLRVARRYAVITTEQILRLARERDILLLFASPHPFSEFHWFLRTDFQTVLGDSVTYERQALVTDRFAELTATGQEARQEEVRDLILEMTRIGQPTAADHGILVIKAKAGAPPLDTSNPGDPALLDSILAHKVAPGQPLAQGSSGLDAFLRSKVACPSCLTPLADSGAALNCTACGRRFEIEHGIPRLHLSPGRAGLREAPRRRWPWLTQEAEKLRAMFTAPRPKRNRLLCYLLSIERGLLGWREHLPVPAIDYLNSEAVRQALATPSSGPEPQPALPAVPPTWWDRLPATEAELEAMRALGMNILVFKNRVEDLSRQVWELTQRAEELSQQVREQTKRAEELSQHLRRIYSRWPVRVFLWLKRLWPARREPGRLPTSDGGDHST